MPGLVSRGSASRPARRLPRASASAAGAGRRRRLRVDGPGSAALDVSVARVIDASSLRRTADVYSFRYSRSRRVCVRLTGISVAFSSFILRM